MRFYFDSCCYSRLYDDQTQIKIYMESEAILNLINICKQNNDEIIGSPALDFELDQIDNIDKREKLKYFYQQIITEVVEYNENILNRVRKLTEITKIRTLDSLHLAFSEIYKIDILLTTDSKFENACSKMDLRVKVINPVNYLMGVTQDDIDT